MTRRFLYALSPYLKQVSGRLILGARGRPSAHSGQGAHHRAGYARGIESARRTFRGFGGIGGGRKVTITPFALRASFKYNNLGFREVSRNNNPNSDFNIAPSATIIVLKLAIRH